MRAVALGPEVDLTARPVNQLKKHIKYIARLDKASGRAAQTIKQSSYPCVHEDAHHLRLVTSCSEVSERLMGLLSMAYLSVHASNIQGY